MRVAFIITKFLILVGIWLLLVFKADPVETVAGGIAVLLTLAGGAVMDRYAQARFALPDGWLPPLLSLPWKIIKDSGTVALGLFKRVTGDPVEGQFVPVPFVPEDDSAKSQARRAMVIAEVSVTPNTVVLDIDSSQAKLLVHQLLPTSEPLERRDPKWPV